MVELRACIGSACHLNGAHNVVSTFQQLIEKYELHDKINFKASFCMKECGGNGVSVTVNGEKTRIAPEEAKAFFKENVLPLV